MFHPHRDLLKSMRWAKQATIDHGADEVLLRGKADQFSETDLLRELAWVILCSGFREQVVRRHFPKISLCFFDWSSSREIAERSKLCVATALDVFGYARKIEAIAQSAKMIYAEGFEKLAQRIKSEPIETLREFPFIGEITAYHLAKNIGFDLAKPDRHLIRIADKYGYDCVQSFCKAIAGVTGDSVHLIDTVLWRVSERGMADQLRFDSISMHRVIRRGFLGDLFATLKGLRTLSWLSHGFYSAASKVRLPA